jgi:hypothetical protein
VARADRKKKGGGRVTPKGGARGAVRASSHIEGDGPEESSRYTRPVPQEFKVSPTWVPVLMFGLLGLGFVIIFCNYLGFVPGGETDNKFLLVGLGCILGGIITATNFH